MKASIADCRMVSCQWSVVSGQWSVVSGQWSVDRALRLTTDHGPRTPRRGISLMEVLISIGLVAIGLLSVLSLLPVGGYQVQRAETEERKATLGMNAYVDFKNRGFANRENWVRYDTSATQWKSYWPLLGLSSPLDPNDKDLPFLPPIAIDPLMVAVPTTTADQQKISNFPANVFASGVPVMKRLTVAQAGTISGGTFTPNKLLADALCVSNDDILADRPDDSSLPAESLYRLDASNNPLKRESGGLYSWLVTIAPTEQEPDHIVPEPMRQYVLSLVIFHRRLLDRVPTNDGTQEEMTEAEVFGDGLGGGDVRLYDNSSYAETKLELARPGQWLMLCRYEPTTDDSGVGAWPVFHWYRVVAAGPVETPAGGGAGLERYVTLSGPDWRSEATFPPAGSITTWPPIVPAAAQNYNTYACLFDGIVAVYQRTIRLEGPSLWGP